MRPVIYQLVVRLFGNTNETRKVDGTLAENGCGRFEDIDDRALASIRALGATHIYLTGVLRQATLTDYTPLGLPADDPDVVKGIAGSFFAIRDYYDVCPDYAREPEHRVAELEALVGRIHAAGMRVLLDLVPNHVARGYGSVVFPERDFGAGDDSSKFFSPANDFYYLPGQSLRLEKPQYWNPIGVVFDGRFGPEDGGPGRTPKVTGNNVVSGRTSATDWYETVKLNYGLYFLEPSRSVYNDSDPTWAKVDRIIEYWQSKGIDGFRVDFAHYVPRPAWEYLLRRAKERSAQTFFLAEAYEELPQLLGAGFDAVYHDEPYDALKRVYQQTGSLDDLDRLLSRMTNEQRNRYAYYLENHDERRVASAIVRDGGADASGFGSAAAGKQLAPILYLVSGGPILFFNGQEVGEPASGAEGFSGDDGRTSIYDYGLMPELAKWVNGHRYDGARLSDEQRELRDYYADLLAISQLEEARSDGYWGLRYLNAQSAPLLFPFARYVSGGGSLLVVVANFAPGGDVVARIRVPRELSAAAGLEGELEVTCILDGSGSADEPVIRSTVAELDAAGMAVEIANQCSNVYRITGAAPVARAGSEPFAVQPIGVIHTPWKDKASAPRQAVAAKEVEGVIELFGAPGMLDALHGLETFDAIWVIYRFHANDGHWRPKVRPPRSTVKRGVFATRSPHRPNGLGLSAVRLVRIEGMKLYVRGVDMLDGTPVIDLKPYVPYADALVDANSGWLDAACDPGPRYEVQWDELARRQTAWLATHHGMDLVAAAETILRAGPEPHAYRRIREIGEGKRRLAIKSWRFDFREEGGALIIESVSSGYRRAELDKGVGEEVALHRAFNEEFAG